MRINTLVALACIGGSGGAEPMAHATLTGLRCIFPSLHDVSRHRLLLRVEVKSDTPGWRVMGADTNELRIKAEDAEGRKYASELCEWEALPKDATSRSASFLFLLRGRMPWLEVDECIRVQLAENLEVERIRGVSLTEQGSLCIGKEEAQCLPDAANSAPQNRDNDGALRRAGLTIIFPAAVNLLKVSRVWEGGDDAEAHPYAQEIEITHGEESEGKRSAHIVLWNAAQRETLEITTCTGVSVVDVPLKFRAMLGDPAPPKEARTSAPDDE